MLADFIKYQPDGKAGKSECNCNPEAAAFAIEDPSNAIGVVNLTFGP
jgi:hypothetical protein